MLVFDRLPVIAVIGDVMLDKYYEGDTERVSPEAPVPVVKVSNVRHVPGGAANVAANLAALGAQVSIHGICGNDAEAFELNDALEKLPIKNSLYACSKAQTISKNRVISRQQQLLRLDYEQNFDVETISKFTDSTLSSLKDIDVLVLSDYAKGALDQSVNIIDKARKLNIPIVVDPKGKNIHKYRGATLVTPNMKEFIELVGECLSEEEVVAKADALMKDADIRALLITRSEKGMTLFQQGCEPVYFASEAQEVFDVTGAGDTVVASLAMCIGAGLSFSRAAYVANVAAGLVVRKMGTSSVALSELNHALKGLTTDDRGVLTWQEAKQKIDAAQQRSERVVFTNGCFDLIHPGHVTYLKQAKSLGDRLIIAVNSDHSVRRLKGESRPINSLENRMEVLAGLASVDWVVSFDEDTPQNVIEFLSPNILVKGGDYQIEDIVGAEYVKSQGGEVHSLLFENGCSTTDMINKILDQSE